MIELDVKQPIWGHFFTVAPLVLIGTKEGEEYNLAPKHMATPLGQGNFFGFVCTPRHSTYHNIKRERAFTVSFPRPDQLVMTSLAASPRSSECSLPKAVLGQLPTVRSSRIDALFLKDAYLWLECELDRIIDGFDDYSLIAGRVVGALVHPDAYRFSDRDEQEMILQDPLLAFLAYGRFARIEESYVFPYPRAFRN